MDNEGLTEDRSGEASWQDSISKSAFFINKPAMPPVSTAAITDLGSGAFGIQAGRERRTLWWRVLLDYVLNPVVAYRHYAQLREERRVELLSNVRVVRGDLTYQDMQIRVNGQLLSEKEMRKVLQGDRARA